MSLELIFKTYVSESLFVVDIMPHYNNKFHKKLI